MKVSLNWLKRYTNIDIPLDELVKKIGAQLGEVESVEHIGEKYKGIFVAKVVECEKHPDADKLSICKIDDGGKSSVDRDENGLITVVCGAPNVKKDMMVVWLPPGVTVPSSAGEPEPFVLSQKELRGVVSNGMIASATELAISDDHSGIVDLEQIVKVESAEGKSASEVGFAEAFRNVTQTNKFNPGDDFAEALRLDDVIIDIENKMFTHRPDCFGLLGVAREVAGICGTQFSSPQWYHNDYTLGGPEDDRLKIAIETELVPRFTASVIDGITVASSPLSLQADLMKVGIKPINNMVDITNYVMYLTGQPLHAYDYNKVAAKSGPKPSLIARLSKEGEKVTILGGKEVTLDKETVVIATDKQVVAIGGIMGGADTEVDATTTSVILECANFDMYSIRRSSMRYGLFTDAVTRFNKGQSPHQTALAVSLANQEAICLIGAQVNGEIYNVQSELAQNTTVNISSDFINARLGSDLKGPEIAQLLSYVEFTVTGTSDLEVTAPFWRTDISIPEDIVEEVGRLYGYDNLPLNLPTRSSKPTKVDSLLHVKQTIRDSLSALGANELLNYSFVNDKLITQMGQDPANSYGLSNALSPELKYYRQTLAGSLLEKVYPNLRAGYKEFAIFEIGKTHNKIHKLEEGLPGEIQMVGFVYASSAPGPAAFYNARRYLDQLAHDHGVELDYEPLHPDLDLPILKPYDASRSALAKVSGTDDVVGIVGEHSVDVEVAMKLPTRTAGFEMDPNSLLKAAKTSPYSPLSKFPSSSQDVTLSIPLEVSHRQVHDQLESSLATSKLSYKLTPKSSFRADGSDTKNLSFSITLSSSQRTLTSQEVNEVIGAAVAATSYQQI